MAYRKVNIDFSTLPVYNTGKINWKEYVNKHSGKGMDFPMGTATFGVMANKYLYVGNSTIRGNDTNKQSGTGTSGIKYENGYYVLRYVLGI